MIEVAGISFHDEVVEVGEVDGFFHEILELLLI